MSSEDEDEDISFSDIEASEEESDSESADEQENRDWEADKGLQQRLFEMAKENGDNMSDEEWLPPALRKRKLTQGEHQQSEHLIRLLICILSARWTSFCLQERSGCHEQVCANPASLSG